MGYAHTMHMRRRNTPCTTRALHTPCAPPCVHRAHTVRIPPRAPARAHRALYQVHAARLRGGAKVVVKLQHVEVARVMRQDMVQSLVLGRLGLGLGVGLGLGLGG